MNPFLKKHHSIALLLGSLLTISLGQSASHAAYPDEVLADSPWVYYRFEESGGEVAENLGTLGAAANGTYSGWVRFGDPSASAQLGQSIWLDGETASVAVPDLGPDGMGQFTIEMWLQRTYDWPGLTALFANDGWDSGFLHLNLVSTESEPQIEFAVNGNPGPFPRFSPDWRLNEWNHLVITYDTEQSPAQVKLYFNGVLNSEVTLPTSVPIRVTGGRLGSWEDQRRFEGNFDEMALYSTVLSAERVDAHYSEARPELRLVIQPQDVTVLLGGTVTLSVSATGRDRSYQWFRDGELIAGAMEAQYTLEEVEVTDNGARFSVQVSNDLGNVLSEEAVLTVISAPEIVTQPVNGSAMESLVATFRVEAIGPDLEYQWFKNGEIIDGATEAVYTTPPVGLADAGALFTVRVSNSAGSVTSATAQLSVTALPPDAYGQSVVQDQPLVYYRFEEAGGNVVQNLGSLGSTGDGVYPDFGVFHAQPSAFPELGNAVLLDGVNGFIGVPDLERPAMSQCTIELWLNRAFDWPGLTALLANDGWDTGFLHFNLVPSDTATEIEFAVNGNPTFPRLLPDWQSNEWNYLVVTYNTETQPGQLRIYLNSALLLDQTIQGAVPIRFTGGRIGMWSESRQLDGFVDEFAFYDVALPASSIEARYNTVQTAVSIVVPPVDRTVLWGESVLFQVTASGPDLQYQWFRNGEEIPGATEREYAIAATTEADDGAVFSVQVSNQTDSVTSPTAMLTVIANVTIESAPMDLAVLAGRTARFEVSATGSGLQYQWFRDGEEIPGATDPVYAFTADAADHGALFSVRVSNDWDTVTSEAASLTVVTKPTTDYATTVLLAEPLVFYRFEESAGASMAENQGSLGFMADGIYSASGLTLGSDSVTPILGNAAAFDMGYVEVPHLGFGALGQVSIEFWLNVLVNPAPNNFSALWANHGWEPNLLHFNIWGGPAVDAHLMEFAVNGNPSPNPRWAPAPTGTWNHWVVTYDTESETPEMRVYLNGLLVFVQPGLTTPILFGGGRIGMWGDSRPLNGLMDEFAIYGTILSHEQVLQHYAVADIPEAPEAVQLNISRISADEVEISWTGSGVFLEFTSDLSQPESWELFPGGDVSPVIVPIEDSQWFFRPRGNE